MKKIQLEDKQLWPAFVRLLKDESFLSWSVRTALSHRLSYSDFYRKSLPDHMIWLKNIDLIDDEALLNAFAALSDTPKKKIRSSKIDTANCLKETIIPFSNFGKVSARQGLMFCPTCFSDDGDNPYFRKSWRLATNFCCKIHGSILKDKCPNCGYPVLPLKYKINVEDDNVALKISECFNCGNDLKTAQTKADTDNLDLITVQNRVDKIVRSKKRASDIFSIINILTDKRKDFVYFKHSIIGLSGYTNNLPYKKFNKLSVDERLNYLRSVLWIMDNVKQWKRISQKSGSNKKADKLKIFKGLYRHQG